LNKIEGVPEKEMVYSGTSIFGTFLARRYSCVISF
jgi:hypothetical protein